MRNHVLIPMLCLGWIISGCTSQTTPEVVQSQINASDSSETLLPFPTATVDESITTDNPELVQVVEGIRIEVKSARVYNSRIEITVCYPLLDSGEWRVQPNPILMGSQTLPPDEFEIISVEPATAEEQGITCAIIRYLVNDKTTPTTPIQFSIGDVYAVPREMDSCEEIKTRISTNMLAQQTGLTLDCTTGDSWPPVIQVVSSVVPIDDPRTQQAIAQLRDWRIDGPWEFTINEIK